MITHKSTILTQSVRASARRKASAPTAVDWLGVALFGVCAIAACSLVANTAPEMAPVEVIRLDLLQPVVSVIPAEATGYWREDRVRRGDTIGSVLARLGVDDPAALEFLRTNPSARPLYQLRPGKPLTVETDDDGRLINLRFLTADGLRLSVARDGRPPHGGIRGRAGGDPVEDGRSAKSGRRCLPRPTRPGLPDAVTLQLADVFAGDIDFYHDLQRGDRFTVVFEARYVDGEPVGVGAIVAAEFDNRGRAFRAFLWRGEDGRENYFARRRRPDAQGIPALADGVLPRDLGLFERPLPPDPAGRGARTRASTTRRPWERPCAPPATRRSSSPARRTDTAT